MEFGNTIRKVGNSHVVTVPAFFFEQGLLREGQYLKIRILEDDDE